MDSFMESYKFRCDQANAFLILARRECEPCELGRRDLCSLLGLWKDRNRPFPRHLCERLMARLEGTGAISWPVFWELAMHQEPWLGEYIHSEGKGPLPESLPAME